MTITVNNSVAGTVSADQTIVIGTQPANITLSGNSGAVQWQSSLNNISFTDIVGAINATLTGAEIGVLTAKKYFRAVVTSGSCISATSGVVTVNITLTSSKIQSAQANSTLSSINSPIFADWVQGVTDYRFKIVANGTTDILERGINRYFYLTSLASGGEYSKVYTVSVSTKYNGVWGIYGTSCTITSPAAPLTKIQDSQCGSVMATVNSPIFANWVQFATDYRFKVVYNGTTEIIERGINRYFYLTSLASGAVYNRSYTVSVATKCNGTWGDYGAECTVTSTQVPATKVQDSQCGTTLATINSPVFADWVPYVIGYRFRVVSNGTTYISDRDNRYFYLSSFFTSSTYAARTFTVEVATATSLLNGSPVFGAYGPQCTITTPSNMSRAIQQSKAIVTNEVEVKVYPNPFTNNFKLDFVSSSDSNVEVVIYDMIGRQLDRLQVESSEMNNLEIGNNYPSGVYNVIVPQGEEVKTLRVIKR
jgi:hypothetical protein